MTNDRFIEFARSIAKDEKDVSDLEWAALSATLNRESPNQIAKKLGVTEDAIRKRLGEVYRKFGIDGRGSGKLPQLQQILISRYEEYLEKSDLRSTAGDVEAKEADINSYQDWGEAPDVSCFYGRKKELATLKQWTVKDRCRVVAILGIGGIGKTALSVKLAQEVKDEFDYVIWRSLRNTPSSQDFSTNLLRFLSNQQEDDLGENRDANFSQVIRFLKEKRCLLIVDGWEAILQAGKLAGSYQKEYESYEKLLQRTAESPHQSCLLLTSREKPRQITAFEGPKLLVRSLELSGLEVPDAKEIFREKNLSEEKHWDRLIKSYRGNPLALKIIAGTIQNFPFEGKVSEFLKYTTPFLGDIEYLLYEQFGRLSKQEKEIMHWLAKTDDSVLLRNLRKHIPSEASGEELGKALASLGRRSLIETVKENGEILLTLQPIIKKYVLNNPPK